VRKEIYTYLLTYKTVLLSWVTSGDVITWKTQLNKTGVLSWVASGDVVKALQYWCCYLVAMVAVIVCFALTCVIYNYIYLTPKHRKAVKEEMGRIIYLLTGYKHCCSSGLLCTFFIGLPEHCFIQLHGGIWSYSVMANTDCMHPIMSNSDCCCARWRRGSFFESNSLTPCSFKLVCRKQFCSVLPYNW